jgi:hypothetical protein
VQVTLIDFTLSRLVTVTGEVAFCDLAADPELFKGPKNSVQVRVFFPRGAQLVVRRSRRELVPWI